MTSTEPVAEETSVKEPQVYDKDTLATVGFLTAAAIEELKGSFYAKEEIEARLFNAQKMCQSALDVLDVRKAKTKEKLRGLSPGPKQTSIDRLKSRSPGPKKAIDKKHDQKPEKDERVIELNSVDDFDRKLLE